MVREVNIYLDADPATAPAELLADIRIEEEEDDDEGVPVFTGRHVFSLNSLNESYIFRTGFPAILDNLLVSLKKAQAAVERRLESTDDFAKHVGSLFGSNRG